MIQEKHSFDACNMSNQLKVMKENHKKNGNNEVTANYEAKTAFWSSYQKVYRFKGSLR
jgi:hypothetical protein